MPIRATAEYRRLEEARDGAKKWRRWGTYLAERQWGTVREDYSAERRGVGVLPLRSRSPANLSLGRRRPAGDVRQPGPGVLRARDVERGRPDPQGAPVRALGTRRQPRRGREGALLVRGRHADGLVRERALQVPAARLPVRPAACPRARGWPARSRDRAGRHGGLRRRPVLRRAGGVRQGRPERRSDARDRDQPRRSSRRPSCCCRSYGFATPGAGAPMCRGQRCSRSSPSGRCMWSRRCTSTWGISGSTSTARRSCSSRTTSPTARSSGDRRTAPPT